MRGGCKATPQVRDKGTAGTLKEGPRGLQGLCPPTPSLLPRASSKRSRRGPQHREQSWGTVVGGQCPIPILGGMWGCPISGPIPVGPTWAPTPGDFGAMLVGNQGGPSQRGLGHPKTGWSYVRGADTSPKKREGGRTPLMHPSSLNHLNGPRLVGGGRLGGAAMGPLGSRQPRHKEECDEHMVPISPGDFFFFSFSGCFFMIITPPPPPFSAAQPGRRKTGSSRGRGFEQPGKGWQCWSPFGVLPAGREGRRERIRSGFFPI